jgi:hypothetical protein
LTLYATNSLCSRLWPPPVGHGLVLYPTTVRLFFLVTIGVTDLSLVVRDFGFTLDEVNWLGNIISCVYLPTAVLTPIVTKRYGLKRCVCSVSLYAVYLLILLVQCDIATALVLLSAWIRYAGTSRSLSKGGAYSLIIIGQVGKNSRSPFSPLLPMLSSGTVRHFTTSIPDFSP